MGPDIKLPSVKLPVEPLLAVLPDFVIAGKGKSRIEEWVQRGLSFSDADKIAVKYGYHPFEIWGDMWTTGEINEEIIAASERILDVVKAEGKATLQEVLRKAKVSDNYVRDLINWLKEVGCIEIEIEPIKKKKVLHYIKELVY